MSKEQKQFVNSLAKIMNLAGYRLMVLSIILGCGAVIGKIINLNFWQTLGSIITVLAGGLLLNYFDQLFREIRQYSKSELPDQPHLPVAAVRLDAANPPQRIESVAENSPVPNSDVMNSQMLTAIDEMTNRVTPEQIFWSQLTFNEARAALLSGEISHSGLNTSFPFPFQFEWLIEAAIVFYEDQGIDLGATKISQFKSRLVTDGLNDKFERFWQKYLPLRVADFVLVSSYTVIDRLSGSVRGSAVEDDGWADLIEIPEHYQSNK